MAGKGQNGKPVDQVGIGTGLALMFGMLVLLFFSAWVIYHDQVARALLKYAYYLNFPLAWISSNLHLQFFVNNSNDIVLLASKIELVTLRDIVIVINKASLVYLPLLASLVYCALKVHQHVLRQLENLHDYWQLMKLQSLTNPCIVPVVRFTEYWRLHNIERHENIARSLTPEEFAKKYELIKKESDQVVMNMERASEVFEKQLGVKLDASKLQPHYKALAAIFMTRIVYRGAEGRKKAKSMQDAINNSCNPERTAKVANADCMSAFDFTEAAGLFDELFKREDMQKIAAFFPFEKIFLMEILQRARLDGKLAPSEFIWLKLVDRPLFYALYGVSKSMIAKGYCEGAGAFTQYWSSVTQMRTDHILISPVMHEACAGLEKRLFEANMISERRLMTEREIAREAEFGRIPEV